MFQKGDFNIKDSWQTSDDSQADPTKHLKPSISKPTAGSLTPGGHKNAAGGSRPSSNSSNNKPGNNQILEKKSSAILSSAAKNLVGGQSSPSPQIDDDLARKLVRNLQMEGQPDNLFAQKRLNPVLGGQGGLPPKKPFSLNQDSDLLASMAARLQKTEQLVKQQREEIKEKSKEIEGLRTEVEIYKQSKDSEKAAEEVRKVQKENVKLLLKVNAMEKFLAEYGLRWTVDETGDEVLKGDLNKERLVGDAKKPKYNYHLPSEIDLNIILLRVSELNYSTERDGGCQEIYKDDRGFSRLRRTEPIPIGFYRDGIAIKGFPFFKYGSPEARQILSDILEGYFPYQLKKDYPNGVPLKVIDKAEEDFNPLKSNPKQANINSIDEDQLKPQSKEEFLSKLPKQVIKNGRVIDIRAEVQKKLEGGSKPLDLVATKNELVQAKKEAEKPTKSVGLGTVQEANMEETSKDISSAKQPRIKHEKLEDGSIRILTEEYLLQKSGEKSENEISELKIRSTKGGQDILVFITISANKLIRDVYRLVDDFNDFFRYELITNYPKKPIPRDSVETLKDLDLFPNSVLNVHEVKS